MASNVEFVTPAISLPVTIFSQSNPPFEVAALDCDWLFFLGIVLLCVWFDLFLPVRFANCFWFVCTPLVFRDDVRRFGSTELALLHAFKGISRNEDRGVGAAWLDEVNQPALLPSRECARLDAGIAREELFES